MGFAAEDLKLLKNGPKWKESSWVGVAIEMWGEKAHENFEYTCKRLVK